MKLFKYDYFSNITDFLIKKKYLNLILNFDIIQNTEF